MNKNSDIAFSIIIPVFNEGKNILNLINEILESLLNYNYEIILYNDGSNDDTEKVLNKLNNKKIKVINSKINKGQSYAIYHAIKIAKNNTIVTIDGDGQNDPKDIVNLFNLYIISPDILLVGGIRKKRRDSILKIISSRIANYIRMKIFNDNCLDTGCSLKIFDKKVFLKFPYFNSIHRFLPALFTGVNVQTKFIYVNHRPRIYGISKYNTFGRLIRGIIDIFKVKNIIKNLNKND